MFDCKILPPQLPPPPPVSRVQQPSFTSSKKQLELGPFLISGPKSDPEPSLDSSSQVIIS